MTDRVTLRYNGIEETLECYKVTQKDWSEEGWADSDGVDTTLSGLPTDVESHAHRVDSEVFREAPGGKRGEYYGVSQSMADPRAEHSEEFPKNVIPSESEIEVVEIEKGVNDD